MNYMMLIVKISLYTMCLATCGVSNCKGCIVPRCKYWTFVYIFVNKK